MFQEKNTPSNLFLAEGFALLGKFFILNHDLVMDGYFN
jgi:hypothetical protein